MLVSRCHNEYINEPSMKLSQNIKHGNPKMDYFTTTDFWSILEKYDTLLTEKMKDTISQESYL